MENFLYNNVYKTNKYEIGLFRIIKYKNNAWNIVISQLLNSRNKLVFHKATPILEEHSRECDFIIPEYLVNIGEVYINKKLLNKKLNLKLLSINSPFITSCEFAILNVDSDTLITPGNDLESTFTALKILNPKNLTFDEDILKAYIDNNAFNESWKDVVGEEKYLLDKLKYKLR